MRRMMQQMREELALCNYAESRTRSYLDRLKSSGVTLRLPFRERGRNSGRDCDR